MNTLFVPTILFIMAIVGVPTFVIHPDLTPGQPFHYHVSLFVGVTFAVVFILYVEKSVSLSEWIDFGIDGYEYEQGEFVQVMISNMGHEDLKLKEGCWQVRRESDGPRDKSLRLQRTEPPLSDLPRFEGAFLPGLNSGSIERWSDHRWLLPTEALGQGLFKVVYTGPVYEARNIFSWQGLSQYLRGKGRYRLLDPENEDDKDELDEMMYNNWDQAAQRFRVLPNKSLGTLARRTSSGKRKD
jgi:hypothetical protein